ncbi:hypothetical protein [Paenibacillus glycanilyticus]|uniref:Uncharacterized protein n=1 Tax=Paenibacillus glycanilyticus TaxID=126569 RepID=A0ABQ6GHR1_9BACL|nr:hypothetical protein [Paenibacillus glycanilyticus]GLX69655.1 hypothetical protein MU1_40000 [Paenibacillus glycanilyticus]
MIKSWDDICSDYERLNSSDNKFLSIYNLVVSIRDSKYSNHIYGWTSVIDLYIVQSKVNYPYNGPKLLVRQLEGNKLEFRYIDTYKPESQWKRVLDGSKGYAKLEEFFFNLHWFYCDFTN